MHGPHAVTIGDTPHDARAAGKASIRTTGMLRGGFNEIDLRKSGSSAVAARIAATLPP